MALRSGGQQRIMPDAPVAAGSNAQCPPCERALRHTQDVSLLPADSVLHDRLRKRSTGAFWLIQGTAAGDSQRTRCAFRSPERVLAPGA